jgi:hypothetical protein
MGVHHAPAHAHVREDLLEEARKAGCERVVSNRSLMTDLKKLVHDFLPDLAI